MNKRLHIMAEAVREAYARGEEDEQLLPRVLVNGDGNPVGSVRDGDPVIFYDIRGEREIELTRAFTDSNFTFFPTNGMTARFSTMIEYHSSLDVLVAFPPEVEIEGTLCQVLTDNGKSVCKVVESEKSIHLSFFLNGKRERPFSGERLRVIESPKDVKNHDEKPEMACHEVASAIIDEISGNTDVVLANFANVDVVGHIENRAAVVKAIEAVDNALGRVVDAARRAGVTLVVTADHGSAEKWLYPDGKVDTGHTDSPVPFLVVDERARGLELRRGGSLIDVAPTALSLMGIPKPANMEGESLLDRSPRAERLALVILDGWGYREEDYGNLILEANTPIMDSLLADYPWTSLAASGTAVGMPAGKVGNSESGHLHIGAGRVIMSDRIRIDHAIADKSYRQNPAFVEPMETAIREDRPLHLLGIVSFYSSHGSVDHLYALLAMARDRGVKTVYHHALLGRRGERPEAGARYIDDVERFCEELGLGRVVTVMGRFWALDREENWDRVEKAYRAIALGEGIPVKA